MSGRKMSYAGVRQKLPAVSRSIVIERPARESLAKFIKKNWPLYVMIVPMFVYFLTFKYLPLLGIVIAFKDYNIFEGFLGSEWVGFQWFETLVTQPRMLNVFKNTVIFSFYQIVFAFPAPIILALLLNEIRRTAYKRTIQTLVYLPHFLSWALVYGLAYMMFSIQTGLVTQLLARFGFEPIALLQAPEYFRALVVGAGVWKEMGWSTIIFLAALTGISPSLYEAAQVDGANRWRQFVHITFPGLLPAIVILMLLKIGNVLDVGFEQIYVFLSPMTYSVGEVLDTYAYRSGIVNGQFSITTAIGLSKSLIGFVLLVSVNRLSNKITGEGLY
ncbi:ABC transporter permease [Cohnella sp. GCM10020058]|uniref:ABC transporter permease n=1 Tax=Cohnella sp. GCM10020058 TaxID=3317330 RepID=UPI003637016D